MTEEAPNSPLPKAGPAFQLGGLLQSALTGEAGEATEPQRPQSPETAWG